MMVAAKLKEKVPSNCNSRSKQRDQKNGHKQKCEWNTPAVTHNLNTAAAKRANKMPQCLGEQAVT